MIYNRYNVYNTHDFLYNANLYSLLTIVKNLKTPTHF